MSEITVQQKMVLAKQFNIIILIGLFLVGKGLFYDTGASQTMTLLLAVPFIIGGEIIANMR